MAFVGPDADSAGGIAMVLKNYSRMPFWKTFGCRLYASSGERGSRLSDLLYQVRQFGGFLPWLLVTWPSVVSIHTGARRSFHRSVGYLLLARLALRPVVLHIHPGAFIEFYEHGGRVGRWIVRMAIAQSDQVVVLSENIRSRFSSIENGAKVVVMPNPVDITEYRWHADSRTEDAGLVVLFVGWIVREKGVYDLVDAVPQVIRDVPGTHFIFAGNKEVEHLKEVIRAKNLQSVTQVAGWVSGEAKLALFRNSHLLVLPSYTEGVPNVLLEAMASGLPVLTTPVGGIPSLVEDGRTGVFVTPGDVPAIGRAITELLRNQPLRERIARAARASIEATYSLESVGRVLVQTYGKYANPAAGLGAGES